MRVVVTDADTGDELWTATQCAEHCGISPATWRGYVSQGRTPGSLAAFERSPLWRADDIRDWHAARPGSPVSNAPTSKAK
ncbi:MULTISPECIES: helix-turn-helix transcriptional regulator [unclassified Dietzia]|uniref:helix-turn-helix transcriptional regulator n=1 Tax=unclassified Dietzia TaxID=2617939 RepID=UPI0015FDE4CB|nr:MULTISPECIES: hypothetical protein [unclassified Dietzia]MBB1023338.1 hypothetical protein [Dietzia sp. DQ12-76]MBB1027531.1 hypothetical protein [Dietzia sp. DQ11-38-2]